MTGTAITHLYRYAYPSALTSDTAAPSLSLATSGGAEPQPHFFTGEVAHPRVTAQLLRSLSRVVQSRYYLPPAMLKRVLAEADPVVTSGDGLLRFEGFSACASAYARVDLTPDTFSRCEAVSSGTTNVDFNADMRAALSRIRDSDRLGLRVGTREVVLEGRTDRVVERKVPLPVRWLKGFVEVQAFQSAMKPCFEMAGTEAARFIRALPFLQDGACD
jgi:hypothetical protein